MGLLRLTCPLCRNKITSLDVPDAVFRTIHQTEEAAQRQEQRERVERDSVTARRLFYMQRITPASEWRFLHLLGGTASGEPVRFRRRVSASGNAPSLQDVILMVPPPDLEGQSLSLRTASIMEEAVDDWWRMRGYTPERVEDAPSPRENEVLSAEEVSRMYHLLSLLLHPTAPISTSAFFTSPEAPPGGVVVHHTTPGPQEDLLLWVLRLLQRFE